MGSETSKLTSELFDLALQGASLADVDAKIEALQKEVAADKWKGLGKLQHPKYKINLLHATCIAGGIKHNKDANPTKGPFANQLDFIKKYIREFDINERDGLYNRTALHFACHLNYIPFHSQLQSSEDDASKLITSFSTVVNKTLDTYTPFKNDYETFCGDVVQELLVEGANADLQDISGTTPLMIAASQSFVKAVEELCGAGASVSLKDTNQRTALMWASANHSLRCVQTIIARCSAEDREASDRYHENALHHAVKARDALIVPFLIKNRCDFLTQRASLKAAAEKIAATANFGPAMREEAGTIYSYFADGTDMFQSSKTGIGPNYLGKTGNGLIDATLLQNAALFQLFLDQGYSFTDCCDKLPNNASPLHVIGSYDLDKERADVVASKMLFAAAAAQEASSSCAPMDWNVKDSDGKTALEYSLAVNTDRVKQKRQKKSKTNDHKEEDDYGNDAIVSDDEDDDEKQLREAAEKTIQVSHHSTLIFYLQAIKTLDHVPYANLNIKKLPSTEFCGLETFERLGNKTFFDEIRRLELHEVSNFCGKSGLHALNKFNALERLEFIGMDFFNFKVQSFSCKPQMPLKYLRISNPKNLSVIEFNRFPQLESLTLAGFPALDDDKLLSCFEGCKTLKSLDMRGMTNRNLHLAPENDPGTFRRID